MGKTLAFTGHRPNKLFGYDLHKKEYDKLFDLILEECLNQIKNNNVDTFISGGALGVDTLAFYVIDYIKRNYKLKVKNILAIPFEDQPNAWINEIDKTRYEIMKQRADKVMYVDTIDKYKLFNVKIGEYHENKLKRRNRFMVDNCDILLAVYNKSDKGGGTSSCIKYANKNKKDIIFINPLVVLGGRIFGRL